MTALLWRGALSAVIVGGFALAGIDIAAADEVTYDATATATATSIRFVNSTIPLGVAPQVGGPSAVARLTSLGQSDGKASYPDLGDVVEGAPGIAGGVLGAPVPSYPLAVATQYGDEPRQVAGPGVTLRSSSALSVVEAAGIAGSSASGSESVARAAFDKGAGVVAEGRTATRALSLPGVGVLTAVESISKVVRQVGGQADRTSSLSFSRLLIPGLALTLPPSTPTDSPSPDLPAPPPVPVPFGGQTLDSPQIGFIDGSFTVTLPGVGGSQQYAVPAEAMEAALKGVGVTFNYQRPVLSPDGVTGATLEFRTTLPAPPDNPGISGPTEVTYTVGGTSARAVLGSGGSSTALPAAGPNALSGGAGTVEPIAPGELGALAAGALPSLAEGTGTQVPTAAFAPADPALASSDVDAFRAARVTGLSSIYLAIAIAVLLSFVTLQALRALGARVR